MDASLNDGHTFLKFGLLPMKEQPYSDTGRSRYKHLEKGALRLSLAHLTKFAWNQPNSPTERGVQAPELPCLDLQLTTGSTVVWEWF